MTVLSVISPCADVFGAPDLSAARGKFESQLVHGENFIVEEEKDGWCRGACAHDGYAGWVEKKHLGAQQQPTHAVAAVTSHLYAAPSLRSPHRGTLSFGSRVAAQEEGNGFSRLENGAWIFAKHLAPLSATETDHAATALKFLEVPYYWGGRGGFGIDCSGLAQVCLARAGIAVGRDTEDQIGAGAAVETPRRGDLVFFPGHVGIMADAGRIVHANAFHMKVTLEPLSAVTARAEGKVTAVRRLTRTQA